MGWEKTYNQSFIKIQKEILDDELTKADVIHRRLGFTARERLQMLFDEGEFEEIGALVKSDISVEGIEKRRFYGDGVIAAFGKVEGEEVYAISQDNSVSGGAGGRGHVKKICETLKRAINTNTPIVFLCDSSGARIEEGVLSLDAYSQLFYLNTMASGLIPQIAAIMGTCAGGSSYSPAMCDFIFMIKEQSNFFITGPRVIKALTGESVTTQELGGAEIHELYSGQAGFVCEDEEDCIKRIRELLSFLVHKTISVPQRYKKKNLMFSGGKKIEDIISENPKEPYDVRGVIQNLMDEGGFFEVLKGFARNAVVGFSRLNGKTIGVVANQPNHMGGAIDCDAADKCARFVRTCDCFGIPLLVLVDVPGFFPGADEERKGILRHGAKLLYAFAEASVPKVTIIMRKAYGGAYCAMNSKGIGADHVFAWPIAEIAVMGADGAVDVIYNRLIKMNDSPDKVRDELIDKYEEQYLTPVYAAMQGLIDEVVLPDNTRAKLIKVFESLSQKQIYPIKKRHGNIAL